MTTARTQRAPVYSIAEVGRRCRQVKDVVVAPAYDSHCLQWSGASCGITKALLRQLKGQCELCTDCERGWAESAL
eukprot:2070754-Alexandrium_andersonii.AAC.1